ncbi:RidA family protein [Streptomyces sp. NPDC048483]|uniref:RidA family protein n=1 Tax=Streptomyces sp. NPDC048483 TaxID=3154927 RepID=UPI00341F6E64
MGHRTFDDDGEPVAALRTFAPSRMNGQSRFCLNGGIQGTSRADESGQISSGTAPHPKLAGRARTAHGLIGDALHHTPTQVRTPAMARRSTTPGLFPPPGYSHTAVVEAGDRLVFTAGAVPLDADGNLVGPGDLAAQTRQVLTNLTAQLTAAGSTLEDVIASTVHVVADTPEALDPAWDEIRASGLSAGPHTSTLLGVTVLGYPGQLVEVTAVAVIPADRQGPS